MTNHLKERWVHLLAVSGEKIEVGLRRRPHMQGRPQPPSYAIG